MKKRFYKKWWFWVIIAIIIFLFFMILIGWSLLNMVCWVGMIQGYMNSETGECEMFSYCPTSDYPEKYVFDEECWHEDMQFGEGLGNLTYFCESVCNSKNKNKQVLCEASHLVVYQNGTESLMYCSDIMN